MPNIACSGIPVKAPVGEWKALAKGDQRLENALVRLHSLFRDADTLGSLIDAKRATDVAEPPGVQTSLEDVGWDEIAPLLSRAVAAERGDPDRAVLGGECVALVKAAELLTRTPTLVATSVPYFGNEPPERADVRHAET